MSKRQVWRAAIWSRPIQLRAAAEMRFDWKAVTDSMAFLQLVQTVSASLDDASAASGRSLESGA